jgi:ADP-ribosyl-[dinitrogen reductase] hydrolase
MRIAPLAFKVDLTWERHLIRDVATITHKNDEAYVGALAVVAAIQQALNGSWTGGNDLIAIVIDFLPDTCVRDRLIELQVLNGQPIQQVGKQLGSSGFVAESVPLAIYAAQQISNLTVEQIFRALIEVGGDTDTICSMTGQLVGSLLGTTAFPASWLEKFQQVRESQFLEKMVNHWT